MKAFRIKYNDGRFLTLLAKNALEVIKKYDLTSKANIKTRIEELSGEQAAIVFSNQCE